MPSQLSERRPFSWLLVTQISFFLATPLLAGTTMRNTFIIVAIFSILFAGIYAAAGRKSFLLISILLIVPAIVAWIAPNFSHGVVGGMLRLLTVALCFFFTVIVVIFAVSRHGRVTRETILGGINAYLLLGLTFMLLHTAILVADPGAYFINGHPFKVTDPHRPGLELLSPMLYLSFTTITTLGYGDITPQVSMSRVLTSTEAVVGQLYFAIFLARLVGMEVSQRRAAQDNEPL